MSEIYKEMGNAGLFADSFALMGDMYMVFYADEGGMGMRSSMEILGDKRDLAGVFPGVDGEVSLVDKVNGTGMIMYMEQAGMGTAFGAVMDYYANLFAYGYNAGASYQLDDPYAFPTDDADVTATDSEKSFDLFDSSVLETSILDDSVIEEPGFVGTVIERPDLQSASLYEEILAAVAEMADISVDEVKEILDSPMALAFSDNGSLVPTFSIYFEIDEDLTAQAKQLAGALDDWMSEFVGEFEDSLLTGFGVPVEGALKKDVVLVNGGGVHRIYLDWSVLPEEAMAGFAMPGLDFEDLSLEFYYGLTGDNVFVIGFEPNFEQNFGKNALADSERYKEAVSKVEDSYGYTVNFFDVQPLIGLIDRYVELARVAKAISASEIAQYDKVMAFVRRFEYMISAGKLDGDVMRSDFYLAIGDGE
ncbi:hypothetical protein HY605_06205 [Candidatus Peregrinibacteria bacterium]|nr:hypothetical protein [Candidatus Peregrinibacteria bacterium]